MPWNETTPMDQKTQFIADYLRGELSMTELCQMYGISRGTGYKFVSRYLDKGPGALEERSRNPSHPNQTPEHIVQAILEMRRRHPSWGAKKLLPRLAKRYPRWDLPSRTTASDILSRHGMVQNSKRTPPRPSADFKGLNVYFGPLKLAMERHMRIEDDLSWRLKRHNLYRCATCYRSTARSLGR